MEALRAADQSSLTRVRASWKTTATWSNMRPRRTSCTMSTQPWRSFKRAEPERRYVCLVSYLPLASGRHVPGLLLYAMRITAQLRKSRGLLGYSLRAQLMTKEFWTLSAWEDEASLRDFVRAQPHGRAMTALAPYMGKTRFIRWTITGSEVPPSWEDALRRWKES